MDTGRLISFEGLDGAGKTTQMELLERWLAERHLLYIRTREPGGTSLGAEIRDLLLHRPELAITPLAEALLLTILLDLDPTQVHMRTDAARDLRGLREQQTRFDAEAESFHRRVQEGFRLLARTHPERIKVVDASLPPEQIHQEIIKLVVPLLKSL